MKTSAIIRIVLYTLVIIMLLGILLAGLGIETFMFHTNSGGEMNTGSGSVDADGITSLNIDWAAGSITIQTGNVQQITFTESGQFEDRYAMVYEEKNGTLSLQYAKPPVSIGLNSTPSKDLIITVPKDWNCEELNLDGAALEINISGISVEELSINGAAFEISFNGALDRLSCDGAACQMEIVCTNRPQEIDLDGAACSLELTIPEDCGFLVQMDGLSCDFDADVEYASSKDSYAFGDKHCQIDVDGLSCEITIVYKS